MRIWVDAHHTAELERTPMPAPIEIKPPRIGIDLHRNTIPGAAGQDSLDINIVAGPSQELAACHMPEDGDERIGDRAENSLSLLHLVFSELTMDARNHEVEAAQHVVGIVERSVRQDVGFDAF